MAEQVEQWRPIANYDMYEVSNMGNVRRTFKNGNVKSLKQSDNRGYKLVSLCSNGNLKTFKVHRLVALAFIEQVGGKLEVDHIDRVRSNNDVNNLRWADRKDQGINTSRYRADIEETDPKLRKFIIDKEYRKANRGLIKAQKREYREANKEAINAKARGHYHANKEARIAKASEYRKANKEAINAKKREKINCECGASISRDYIYRHRTSKKHQKFIEDQNE